MPDLTKIGGFIGYRPTRTLEQILEDVIASSRSPLSPSNPADHQSLTELTAAWL